jgi:hypothetical protein
MHKIYLLKLSIELGVGLPVVGVRGSHDLLYVKLNLENGG